MSEMKDRMLAGELYLSDDPELVADKQRCALLVQQYNATSPTEEDHRKELLAQLLGGIGPGTVIRPPVYFDYGRHTAFGQRSFVNKGAMILDVGRVDVGDDVQIGPYVQLLTPTHPMDATRRREGWEAQAPITIESGVWLGGGVIVCAGVTIGEDSVIGAGGGRDTRRTARVFAAGNPCRVIRDLRAERGARSQWL